MIIYKTVVTTLACIIILCFGLAAKEFCKSKGSTFFMLFMSLVYVLAVVGMWL